MSTSQLSQFYLRLFKGAPISCLVAILISEAPITLSSLKALTGYTTGEILTAMEILCNYGIVIKHPDGTWEYNLPLDVFSPQSRTMPIN